MKWLDIDVSKVTSMYLDEGVACKKIAEVLGVSESVIRTRLSRAGINLRNCREAALETFARGRVHHKKGTGCLNGHGYVVTTHKGVQRRMHAVIAETAIGKELPREAVVHHVNGDRSDNRNSNLVVCPSHSYHMLIHRRQRALDQCGNANWLMCRFCKQYDEPINLHVNRHCSKYPDNVRAYHRACASEQATKRGLLR